MLWHRHLPLLLLAGTGTALLLAFPWFMSNLPALGMGVALFFSQLCHQDPNRSFALAGTPLPVCARCLGLYVGGFLAIAGYPLASFRHCQFRKIMQFLMISLGLIAIDAGADVVGLRENTFISRSLTGALFGGACGVIVSFAMQQSRSGGSFDRRRDSAIQTIHPPKHDP